MFKLSKFKLLWNCHLKLYKSSCNSKGKGNKIIFNDFLRGLEISYELFDWEFWGLIIFWSLIWFLSNFSAINASRRGLHLLFEHHKQTKGPSSKNENPYLNCSNIELFTLVYSFLLYNWPPRQHLCWKFQYVKFHLFSLKNNDFLKSKKNPSYKS